jgi:hypothetical protein
VYFLATEDPRKTSIEYLDFTTGKTLRIADLEGQIGLGFSVSPDAKTFLYGRSAKPEADLVLIGNFR